MYCKYCEHEKNGSKLLLGLDKEMINCPVSHHFLCSTCGTGTSDRGFPNFNEGDISGRKPAQKMLCHPLPSAFRNKAAPASSQEVYYTCERITEAPGSMASAPLRCEPFMLTILLLVQFPQHSPLAYLHRLLTLHLPSLLRLSLGALMTSLKALILGEMGTEPSQGEHWVGSRSVTSVLRLTLWLRMPQSSLVYGQRWVNVPVLSRRLETNQHPKKDWTWTWWGFWTSSRPPWGRSSETVSEKWLASRIDFNNSDVIF